MLFRERQQIVIFFLAGLMIGGFVLFRYLPLRARTKTVEQKKAAQTLIIAQASTESDQLPALEEQLQKLQTAVENYEAKIPVQRALGVFLEQMANLMNEYNLKGQLIEPGDEMEAGVLNCIPISMQCKGSLEQIFQFFKLLQGLDRSVRIEQVELKNKNDFSGEVTMQTKAVIYYRPQDRQG